MTIVVTIDRAQYVDGVPFEIAGLGIVKNRVATTITAEQEREYAHRNQKTVLEGLKSYVTGTPELPGVLADVLGYDPADVNSQPPPVVSTGDLSPATSLGEVDDYKGQSAPVVEAPTPVSSGSTVYTPPVVTEPKKESDTEPDELSL